MLTKRTKYPINNFIITLLFFQILFCFFFKNSKACETPNLLKVDSLLYNFELKKSQQLLWSEFVHSYPNFKTLPCILIKIHRYYSLNKELHQALKILLIAEKICFIRKDHGHNSLVQFYLARYYHRANESKLFRRHLLLSDSLAKVKMDTFQLYCNTLFKTQIADTSLFKGDDYKVIFPKRIQMFMHCAKYFEKHLHKLASCYQLYLSIKSMADVYRQYEHLTEYYKYLNQAFDIASKFELNHAKSNSGFDLAVYSLYQNDWKKADYYYNLTYNITKHNLDYEVSSRTLTHLSLIEVRKGNQKKATALLEKAREHAVLLQEKVNKDYFTSVQNQLLQERDLLNKEKRFNDLLLKNQIRKHYFTIYISSGVILIIITSFLYFYDIQRRNSKFKVLNLNQINLIEKYNSLILLSKIKALEAENIGFEKAKNSISQELHDQVANTIASIKIMLFSNAFKSVDKVKMDIIRNELSIVYEKVRDFSHNLFDNYIEEISLTDKISNYVNEFNQLNDLVLIKLTITEEVYPNKIQAPYIKDILSILQELILNVLKHTNASEIYISISIVNNYLTINVKDNGLDFKINPEKTRGIGLLNIQNRIQKYTGAVSIIQNNLNKVEVNISIPLSSIIPNQYI